MVDIQASLGLHLAGMQKSLDGLDKRVQDFVTGWDYQYKGVKQLRLPIMQGTVTAAGISIGESSGQECGPSEGYQWALRRLIVAGLANGATPDIVNIFRGSSGQQGGLLWQLNGNNFGVTFGKGEMTLQPGDRLQVTSLGAVTAAVGTQITVSGEITEVPAEMFAKLLL